MKIYLLNDVEINLAEARDINGIYYPPRSLALNRTDDELADIFGAGFSVRELVVVYPQSTYEQLYDGFTDEDDGVTITRTYNVRDMTADELKAATPAAVMMRQARQALNSSGLLTTVDSAIAAMPGAAGDQARIDWTSSTQVQRDWPLVATMGVQLGLTEEQLDALFRLAATL